MDRVKPVQEVVRVKLPAGVTWESLAAMTPDQIRDQNLFPKGFYPLPHPKHQEGGFVFPHFVIDAIKQQDGRDLQRFDIDFDFSDWFLPEFPPANSGNLDGATSRTPRRVQDAAGNEARELSAGDVVFVDKAVAGPGDVIVRAIQGPWRQPSGAADQV